MKVLGPATDFLTWRSGKGTENHREFDFEGQRDLITELTQDWGNRLLESTHRTLCALGPRRKEQWPHKRLSQTCLWVSRSFRQRRGSTLTCHGVRGIEYNSACISPFEGGCCHNPYHSLASGQTIGRKHSPTHQQKIGLKIYWAWPCPSDQDPDSPTSSPFCQEASTSLLSLPIRRQAEWKPKLQKTNQTDHLDHSLI